jgi:hypothetical protein
MSAPGGHLPGNGRVRSRRPPLPVPLTSPGPPSTPLPRNRLTVVCNGLTMGGSFLDACTRAWLAVVLSLSLASLILLLSAPRVYYPRRHWLAAAQRVLRSTWILVRSTVAHEGPARGQQFPRPFKPLAGVPGGPGSHRVRALRRRASLPTAAPAPCPPPPSSTGRLPQHKPRDLGPVPAAPRGGGRGGRCGRRRRSGRAPGAGGPAAAGGVLGGFSGEGWLVVAPLQGPQGRLAAQGRAKPHDRRRLPPPDAPTAASLPASTPRQCMHLLLFPFPFRYAAPVHVSRAREL